ncbi:DUF5994 family protein [Nonomuraea sp. bgisy101]|uniref:DUF5994 family protein n=1 Tax=Nonomuraea sp. bgisy101 TaxID=3413784 RepID=UPI003D74640E
MPNHDLHIVRTPLPPQRTPTARIHLEPTLTRDGRLDGAWWPRSTDPRLELPALVSALDTLLGPVLRVRLDLDAWDDVPADLLVDGRFLRVSGFPGTTDTVRLIRGDQDGFELLVVPPDTAPPTAAAAMKTAARTGNTLSATEILAHCRPPHEGSTLDIALRPYRPSDQAAVLALVEADHLPGQPICSPEVLDEAIEGTCRRDPGPWALFHTPRTEVMVDEDDQVLGAVSYAVRRDDGEGLILWLHGREILVVVEALVSHALEELSGRRAVHAFASTLGLGPSALPCGRRPVTRKVLEHAGFSGRNSWRYLRRATPGPCLSAAPCPLVEVVRSMAPPGWWLRSRDDDLAAEVVAQTPADHVGALWWFGADALHTDETFERAMLREAITLLRGHGASETVLYADDEQAEGRPTWTVFADAGFVEIDRLVSYAKRGGGTVTIGGEA